MYDNIKEYFISSPKDFNDILIIEGDYLNSYDTYSRTAGLAEYLNANRLYTKIIKQKDLSLDFIKYFRGFILLNVTSTPLLSTFIQKCNYFNKSIFKFANDSNGYPFDDSIIKIKLEKDFLFLPDEYFVACRSESSQIYNIGTVLSSIISPI